MGTPSKVCAVRAHTKARRRRGGADPVLQPTDNGDEEGGEVGDAVTKLDVLVQVILV